MPVPVPCPTVETPWEPVCFDDGLQVPFMIDSSKFPIVEAGLKWVQGKSIVNSISLKVRFSRGAFQISTIFAIYTSTTLTRTANVRERSDSDVDMKRALYFCIFGLGGTRYDQSYSSYKSTKTIQQLFSNSK